MKNELPILLSKLNIQVNDKIYLKDPGSSELGQRIVSGSIELIDDIGFENFTFRKLGQSIKSPEASIYRYFESKHKILLYLTSWYWSWMEYKLAFAMANVPSAKERLMRSLSLLTSWPAIDGSISHINESKLHSIVIKESSKSYLTKDVDTENKDGVFMGYKQLVARVAEVIKEINPDFKYPHMLISTVIEGAHHQRYFAEHLPKLTDILKGEDSITEFYKDLVFKSIAKNGSTSTQLSK
ncbi:MAG: TetR/AcrR family transcriptional regulator [Vicingaceae bacterium]